MTAALRGDLELAHRLGDDYSHVSGFLAQMDRPLHRTLVRVQCRFNALWLRRPWAFYLRLGLWAVALNQVQDKFAFGFTLLLPLIFASPLLAGQLSLCLHGKGLRGRIPLMLALGAFVSQVVVAYVWLREVWLIDRAQLVHLFDFGLFYWIFWLVCGSLMRRPSIQLNQEDLLANSQSRTLFKA